MATSSHPQSRRPLLDLHQFERAGRRVRQWLNSLAAQPADAVVEDDIPWEDGEPRDERRLDPSGR